MGNSLRKAICTAYCSRYPFLFENGVRARSKKRFFAYRGRHFGGYLRHSFGHLSAFVFRFVLLEPGRDADFGPRTDRGRAQERKTEKRGVSEARRIFRLSRVVNGKTGRLPRDFRFESLRGQPLGSSDRSGNGTSLPVFRPDGTTNLSGCRHRRRIGNPGARPRRLPARGPVDSPLHNDRGRGRCRGLRRNSRGNFGSLRKRDGKPKKIRFGRKPVEPPL